MIAVCQPAPREQREESQVTGKAAFLGTWGGRRVSKPAGEISAESWLQEWVSGPVSLCGRCRRWQCWKLAASRRMLKKLPIIMT